MPDKTTKNVTAWSQIAPPPKHKPVPLEPVPGIGHRDGGPVRLFARKLTSHNLDEYQALLRDPSGASTAESVRHSTRKFLGCTLCDQHANLLFDDPMDAVEALAEFDASVVERLYAEVVKAINADMSDKAIARAEKNSETTPSDSSAGTS